MRYFSSSWRPPSGPVSPIVDRIGFRGSTVPDVPEAEQRYLTHDQLHRVAVAAGRLRTLVLVLGYCGLRLGEATALRVGDVDIAARRIRVRRSVTPVRKTGLVEGRQRTTPAAR